MVRQAVRGLLHAIGERPDREGLRETPRRVAQFYAEAMHADAFEFTTFEAEGHGDMVVQSGVPFYSLCEHHLVPFFGTATVAYIPQGRLVGLSKLARAVQYCAKGLQNQERITGAVADMLAQELKPQGVGVVLRARHLCMEMRGPRTHDVWTTTSRVVGCFRDDRACRDEFMRLAHASGSGQ